MSVLQGLPGAITMPRVSTPQARSVVFASRVTQEMGLTAMVSYFYNISLFQGCYKDAEVEYITIPYLG